MKAVRYFQPYSTNENVVTNATLLFLSHIYRLAPRLFEDFLTDVTEDPILVGPVFGNQESKKGKESVVDAIIRQSSFEINIETKIGNKLDPRQIKNHINGMAREGKGTIRVLLGITRTKIPNSKINTFKEYGLQKNVNFAATTFDMIASFFENELQPFQVTLREIVEEYRTFISERGLVPDTPNKLLINPCGTSHRLNAKYSIYHDQPGRSKVICKYLGCYWNKSVRLIGEVQSVFLAEFNKDKLKVNEVIELPWLGKPQKPASEALKRVTGLVNETNYYTLKDELVRYYVVDKFHELNYEKASKHGIQGHRYFDLDGDNGVCSEVFSNGEAVVAEIVEALNQRVWN